MGILSGCKNDAADVDTGTLCEKVSPPSREAVNRKRKLRLNASSLLSNPVTPIIPSRLTAIVGIKVSGNLLRGPRFGSVPAASIRGYVSSMATGPAHDLPLSLEWEKRTLQRLSRFP